MILKKKSLALVCAIALFSNVAMGTVIEDMSWGVNLGGGGSIMGTKYKVKEGASVQSADMIYFGGASLFFCYNFSKMFGVEVNLGARMLDGFKIKADQTDVAKATRRVAKSTIEADITNATLDVLLTTIPMQYDGGCVRISLGPQFTYIIMKEVKIKDITNKQAEKIIKDINIDIAFKANASFLDDIISAGIIVNYTTMNQIDAAEVKKITIIKDSILKFGAGRIKVGGVITFNVVPIIVDITKIVQRP